MEYEVVEMDLDEWKELMRAIYAKQRVMRDVREEDGECEILHRGNCGERGEQLRGVLGITKETEQPMGEMDRIGPQDSSEKV